MGDYLANRWAHRETIQHVRVGAIPFELPIDGLSEPEIRSLGVFRRWVDAVVIDPPTIRILEASVVPDPGDLGKLLLYLRLWPNTPEYHEFSGWPVEGRLVWAVDDPPVRALARELGLSAEIFHPPWVDDYFERLAHRHRRAPLVQQ